MKHSGVLVPKLARLYSRVMLASLLFSSSLYLMEGKAAMQTIIINDFVRFLFKHAFIFGPLCCFWAADSQAEQKDTTRLHLTVKRSVMKQNLVPLHFEFDLV